jgi:hypothetical protein
MQQMLATLPDSFQLAMVVFGGYEMVVGECNSGFRGSAGRRRRRLSKGPVGDCKGYVALRAWRLVGRRQERVSAPRLQVLTRLAQQSKQGKASQEGRGGAERLTGYGKAAG